MCNFLIDFFDMIVNVFINKYDNDDFNAWKEITKMGERIDIIFIWHDLNS